VDVLPACGFAAPDGRNRSLNDLAIHPNTAGSWKWKDQERAPLRAELDAAYFHLYRLTREDVEYILGTFQGIVNEDERADGNGITRSFVLEACDQFKP
jgi:hypothetical protein